MEERIRPIVVWLEIDTLGEGIPDIGKYPVALEPSEVQIGVPLGLSIPAIARGVLLEYWKNANELEIEHRRLAELFNGLLGYTNCDNLSEFVGATAEEVREEYGPDMEVKVLVSGLCMGVLDERLSSNLFASLAVCRHAGVQDELEGPFLTVLFREFSKLLTTRAFGFVADEVKEFVAVNCLGLLKDNGQIGLLAQFVQQTLPKAGIDSRLHERILLGANIVQD